MGAVQERVAAIDNFGTHIQWGSVVGGAIAAAAISFVLFAFGSGIGLSVSSTSPTWRDTSTALTVVSGAYLIFMALVSFGLGGYVAGRMRPRVTGTSSVKEIEFRDGMHGLFVWALAIVIGAFLGLAATWVATRTLAPAGGQGGESSSVVGESTLAYELDTLFRSPRVPRDADMTYPRAEAARILLTSQSRNGVSADDRDALARLVTAYADIPPPAAQDRVNAVIPQAQRALKQVRESGILIAFMTAAALMIGLVVAWFSAREGGREREIGGAPSWRWSLSRPARL